MNLINHGGITKKIKGYLDSETSKKELSSIEKEKEFAKLNLIFNNQFDDFGYLENIEEFKKNNKIIYYYNVISVDKQKRTEYIAISENDRPLLLMSYSNNNNKDIKYVEEMITTYNKENNRISSRVKNNLMIIDSSAVLDLNILDSNKEEYYKKEYKFYYNVDKIVAYQIDEDKFFNTDDYRLDLAIQTVDKVSNKMNKKVDEYLEINLDYVKEYKIKRKVK